MTEENLFKLIDTIYPYDDGIGKVSLYDASHSNESKEQRIYTVTTIASLAYGNESAKNPEALYERMKSIKHESLWEFIRSCFNSNDYGISSSVRQPHNDILWYERQVPYLVELHKQNIACFRIKVPIFVARQFMRHRSFSYLEMSRRYTKGVKIPFEFWFPQELREHPSFDTEMEANGYIEQYKSHIEVGGLHTQVASRFLPQTTYTEFYVMGEVEGLKNFFRLRLDEHAQTEIREVAEAMLQLLQQHQSELHVKVSCESN